MGNNIAIIDLLRKCFVQDKITLNYHGIFDDLFTEQLISLSDYRIEKKAKKRMALLISESFQNIVRHGDTGLKSDNNSLFGIRGIDHFLHIFSANLVTESTKVFLEEQLEKINRLEKEEIKLLYIEALKSSVMSDKGGAGLGLIEMARKSERPIQKEFENGEGDLYAFFMQIDLLINDSDDETKEAIPLSIKENLEIQKLIIKHDIIFLYKGDFSTEIMSPILSIMQQNTGDNGKTIGFKIFHTTVELMQNIVRYGKEIEGKKEGLFALNKTKDGYYVSSTNYVDGDTHRFKEFVDLINTKDKVELDQLYRSVMKENVSKEGDSAGVGLIDLRRSMMTPLDVQEGVDQYGTYIMIGIELKVNDKG